MKAMVRERDAHEAGEVEAPTPVVEARVEERPAAAAQLDQEPAIVAQELGLEQQDRELV